MCIAVAEKILAIWLGQNYTTSVTSSLTTTHHFFYVAFRGYCKYTSKTSAGSFMDVCQLKENLTNGFEVV